MLPGWNELSDDEECALRKAHCFKNVFVNGFKCTMGLVKGGERNEEREWKKEAMEVRKNKKKITWRKTLIIMKYRTLIRECHSTC